ncbi:MAG: hypothetical protein IJ811_03680, partial [Clostridia bacterium]|nr:hypothetical protein [Clostridia bacterium]
LTALIVALVAFAFLFAASIPVKAHADETNAVTGMNVSLGEDIIVKFHTTAVKGDGSYMKVSFNGNEYEMTTEDGVFRFNGVAPQLLGKEYVATLYDAEGAVIGSASGSVKNYLTDLLGKTYEQSGCADALQYAAMRELCVDLLNYGAAAQKYVDYDIENLVNAQLSQTEAALATADLTAVDKKAVNGAYWKGANVRFNSNLGVYFAFDAENVEGLTVTINGEQADPAYDAANKFWTVRYQGVAATDMNEPIVAVISEEGKDDQTFTYSLGSYVYAKQGKSDAIAELVNAVYKYGYAAVAYSNVSYVAPTTDNSGAVAMENTKGYDYTGSAYAPYEIPALSDADYTVTAEAGVNLTFTPTTEHEFVKTQTYAATTNVYVTLSTGDTTEYVTQLQPNALQENALSFDNGNFYLTGEFHKSLRVYNAKLIVYGETSFTNTAEDTLGDDVIYANEFETQENTKLTLTNSGDINGKSGLNATTFTLGVGTEITIDRFSYGIYMNGALTVPEGVTLTLKNNTSHAIGTYATKNVNVYGTIDANYGAKDDIWLNNAGEIYVYATGTLNARAITGINVFTADNGAEVTIGQEGDTGLAVDVRLFRNHTKMDVFGNVELNTKNSVAPKFLNYETGDLFIRGHLYVYGKDEKDRFRISTGGTVKVYELTGTSKAVSAANINVQTGASLHIKTKGQDGITLDSIKQEKATCTVAGVLTMENLASSRGQTGICFNYGTQSSTLTNTGTIIFWNYGNNFGCWNGTFTVNHNSGSHVYASYRPSTEKYTAKWNGGAYDVLTDRPADLPTV